ncbi:MAG: rod shape-determining protein MreD [Bacteroidales bacterium]
MINSIIRYIVLFVLLLLLQILLFNNIQFSGYVNPYVYIIVIMLLPATMADWLLILVSFFTGLAVDLMSGTPGMHAGATVAAGFVRPYILRVISPRDGYEAGEVPSMQIYGFRWFLLYTLLLVGIHHFVLFYLEVFRFAGFFRTLLRVIVSTVFSSAFILLAEYYRKGR